MRLLTAGESHGPAVTAVLEGLPAGIPVKHEYINQYLACRQKGYGRGGRMQIEKDEVQILSGIRKGLTLGSPVTMQILNRDWENWKHVMDPGENKENEGKKVTSPRPGHADLPGGVKYGHRDLRNVLERSSARETAARAAAGAVASRFLEELGIELAAGVISIGGVQARWPEKPLDSIINTLNNSELNCPDPEAEIKMKKEIDDAREKGDSLGGIFEVHVQGLPAGLGSHVQWDRKLDGRLAGALMSIQAIKGVEVGCGFESANLPGSSVHDEIYHSAEKGFYRSSNRAGGIEGGISNGETVVVSAAMKPIPTLYKPLYSVDLETKERVNASVERSDVCAVPAASIVGKAVAAYVLAGVVLEKFGGDHLEEVKERVKNWRDYVYRL
ncbi:MAG: chorismate synthase [Clostridiales bacterium]|nr:chorismate synthase [Clostridiales bacterium]MCF8021134.1 chorismate synthase [Clostridiales bacterium]